MRGRFTLPALRVTLRSERGIAMPAVLGMIIVGLALGGAAITASVGAQKTSTRDQMSKEALAAADAGLQQAVFRQNKVATSDLLPCVVPSLNNELVSVGLPVDEQWCPEVEGTVGDATFRYRIKPLGLVNNGLQREIHAVSIGTSGDVSRRISIGARAQTGNSIFSGADLVGLDGLNIDDSSSVEGDVGSNGSVNLSDAANLCGNVTYGYGGVFDQEGNWLCPLGSGEGEFSMPPPLQGTVPPSAGGNNSNFRMFTQDTRSPVNGNAVQWDPDARVLTLGGNGTVTLGGDLPYSFCQINMDGSSSLIAAEGAVVKLYFDTPENCGQTAEGGACTGDPPGSYQQLNVIGNAKVIATSSNPADFQFLFVGSDQCPTSAVLTGNSTSVNEFVMYGPRTDIQLNGSATLQGAITGQSVTTDGSSTFLADPDIADFDVAVALNFQRTRYIECAGSVDQSPPDASC